MANIDTLDIRISADSKKAIEEVNKLSASLSKLKGNKFSNLDTQTKNITKSVNILNTSIGKVISKLIGGISLGKGINEINNYIESMNLFRTTMRSQAKEAEEWADKVNHAFHIDKAQFTRNEGIFMAMATGMGIADEQAYKLSKGMTEMAYDLSSFTNLPIEEAFTKLRSALAGEIEPLRAVGVSVTQATLQHKALELGIKENVNAMTDAEKSILRYKVILDSLKNMGAIGDFAKTLDSPANALRILKMQVIELSRAIGSIFIPILVKVLPYIQAFVQVVAKAINSLARLFGFKMPEWKSVDWGSKGAENLGVNLGKANKQAKKLKDYTMGFDELNIIKPDTGNGGGIGENLGGIGNLDIESVWDDKMLKEVNNQVDEIAKKMETIFKIVGVIGLAFLGWKISKKLFTGFDLIKLALKTIGGEAGVIHSASTLMFGEKATTGLIAINKLLGKTYLGSKYLTGSLGNTALILSTVTLAVIGLGVGFYKVYNESELFRDGIKAIGDIVGSTFKYIGDMSIKAYDALKEMFSIPLPKELVDLIHQLDLGIGDLLITAGGFALFGPWGLAIEGVVLAIKGLGYATSSAIPEVNLFGEGISEATKAKVEPFINSMNELETTINGLELRQIEITMTEVEDIQTKLKEIVNTIVTELDSDMNEALKNLDPLKNAMSTEKFEELTNKVRESYQARIEETRNGEEQIKAILNKANQEKRTLTQDEYNQISAIQLQMKDTGIKYLSESELESNLILTRLKDNATELSAKQASSIIQDALRCKNETIAAANEQYNGIALEAQRMLETETITKTEYDEIIAAAQATRDETVLAAEEQYDDIYTTAESKMGEYKGLVDKDTGEIKKKWEVMWDKIKTNTKTFFTDNINLAKQWFKDIGTWWNDNVAPKLTLEYWINKFKNFTDGLITSVKNGVNGGIALFNQFIDWVNGKMQISWEPKFLGGIQIIPGGSFQLFSLSHIPMFKDGGFIEDGLFTMNKGEIAGKFNNGKSVVANNEQIIEGISQGVYQAVMSAMADNNNEKPINVNVYLDGSQINASVERARDEQGLDIFGNELGYTY